MSTTTRELSVAIAFNDSTKRSIKFVGIPQSAEGELKNKVLAIKSGTYGSTPVTGWQTLLLSAGGATASGVAGAVYTVTTKTPIYDSATYEG